MKNGVGEHRLANWPTRAALKQGQVPVVDPRKLRTLRSVIHWELAAVALLLLFAALMARGIGHLG